MQMESRETKKTRDFYKEYKKKTEKSPQERLTSHQFGKVLELTNKRISKALLYEAFEFIMPHRLGVITIYKYEMGYEKMAPDWKATKELWNRNPEAKAQKKIVPHLNLHSDGFYARFVYKNNSATVPGISMYKFVPTRGNKAELGKIMKENKIDYYDGTKRSTNG